MVGEVDVTYVISQNHVETIRAIVNVERNVESKQSLLENETKTGNINRFLFANERKVLLGKQKEMKRKTKSNPRPIRRPLWPDILQLNPSLPGIPCK